MPADPTYTYSSNPATDNKDAVRALISDTNRNGSGTWLLSDEEILFALTSEGGVYFAAALCCEMIEAQFTGPNRNVVSKKIGDLQIESGGRTSGSGLGAGTWAARAKALRARAARSAPPSYGGVNVIDRQDRTDTSLLQPQFVRGMDDYSGGDIADGEVLLWPWEQ